MNKGEFIKAVAEKANCTQKDAGIVFDSVIDTIVCVLKKGEKIPLDGIIIKGNSKLDNSSLTGESKLVSVKEQDEVLSGTINIGNILEIKVTKDYENST